MADAHVGFPKRYPLDLLFGKLPFNTLFPMLSSNHLLTVLSLISRKPKYQGNMSNKMGKLQRPKFSLLIYRPWT